MEVYLDKKGEKKVLLIDSEDYNALKEYKFSVNSYGYVVFYKEGKYIPLHRHLVPCNSSQIVSHKDGNKLNNQKSNLEIVSKLLKKRQKSKEKSFRGIKYRSYDKKWVSSIAVNHVVYKIGDYSTKEEAAFMYDRYSLFFHGIKEKLNFPDKENVYLEENKKQEPKLQGPEKETSSKYVGVTYDKGRGKWRAHLRVGMLKKHIGWFPTEIEAAYAYNEYVIENKIVGKDLNSIPNKE